MAQWHCVLIWERFFALTAPILHPGVYICTNKLSGKPEKMLGAGGGGKKVYGGLY